jgi:hypothetical protein
LKTKDIQKQKYEDKKNSKNKKRREKITCDCGIIISRGYFLITKRLFLESSN